MMERNFLISALFFLLPLSLQAQGDQYLAKFNAQVIEKQVLISWTTSEGFTCEDMTVVGGTDSTKPEVIHVYPGLCGEEDKEVAYSYLWENPPLNQTIYLQMDLGTFGYSSWISVKVQSISNGESMVIPNPVTDISDIIFQLNNANTADMKIYSDDGREVLVIEDLRSGDAAIDHSALEHGSYHYILTAGSVVMRGRFVVVK